MELGYFGCGVLCLARPQPECILPGAGGDAGEALVRVNLASARHPGQKRDQEQKIQEEWRPRREELVTGDLPSPCDPGWYCRFAAAKASWSVLSAREV